MELHVQPDARLNKAAVYGIAAGLLLFVYFGSYVLISKKGRYEPAAFGSKGVKNHMWAPQGFPAFASTNGMTWQWLFVPLWLLDSRIWHPYDKAYDFGYQKNQWHLAATPPGWRVMGNTE